MSKYIKIDITVTHDGEAVYNGQFFSLVEMTNAIPDIQDTIDDHIAFNAAFAESRLGQRILKKTEKKQTGTRMTVHAVMQEGIEITEQDFQSGKTMDQLKAKKAKQQAIRDARNRKQLRRIEREAAEGIPQDAGGNMTEEVYNDEVLGLTDRIEPPEVGES